MKWLLRHVILTGLVTACAVTGCSSPQETTETQETAETQEAAGAEAAETQEAVSLEELSAMLGMEDLETAELFGGGTENWTEDKETYIGRIYSVELNDRQCQVYTSCGDDETVESVSIWIVNGEHNVTDAEAAEWADLVTDFMGTEPITDSETSEGGSRNHRWRADGMAASMYQMKDSLSVSLQPAVGELK